MRFRITHLFAMVMALCAVGSLAARADTLNGGILTTWTGPGTGTTLGSTTSPTENTASPNPYWNGLSGDGSEHNVGWCLTTSNCLIAAPPGNLPYYSSTGTNTTNNAPTNMYFTGNVGGASSTLLVNFTSQQGKANGVGGFNNLDSLYYYLTNSSGVYIPGSNTFLFTAAAAINTSASMTIPAGDGYGFLLVNGPNGSTTCGVGGVLCYYMNDTLDSNADGAQHFAIFQQSSSSYYIGIEDGNFLAGAPPVGTDKDFNDMIIHLTPAGAPEPASMGLLGGSLVLMAGFVRRRSRKAARK